MCHFNKSFSFYFLKVLFLFVVQANITNTTAQNQENALINYQYFTTPLRGSVNVSEARTDLFFSVQNLEMPAPGSGSYRAFLLKQKQQIASKIYNHKGQLRRSTVDEPALRANFEGNVFNGHVPNDNDIAISNDGLIMSVINSSLYFFNRDSMIADPVSLSAFAGNFPQKEGKYDPKVLYDPNEDRFILTFLNGFNDSTSYVFMAFSQTNDPTGDWNIYTLPGNPLHDTSWSDFPMIALTQGELFFTINLLRNPKAGENWKTTFKQTIIWQIDKKAGFNGDSLSSKMYKNIQFENVNLRNICPVQGGSSPAGPNMYLLSNRNFSSECDSFFLVEITGTQDDPKTKLNVELIQSDKLYGLPPLADQPHTPNQPNWKKFETNDARVLDAYFEKDRIYFVGNTINFKNNFASFYHGKISGLSSGKSLSLEVMDEPSLEFGYPSIAFTGLANADEHIILVNHTSDSINPGVSALFWKNGEFSGIKMIKDGETKVSVQGSPEQRWGDYTGLQRKYNEKGVVWGAGYFGKKRGAFPTQVNGTWLFELISPTYNFVNKEKTPQQPILYPNPASDIIHFQFNNFQATVISFYLCNVQGQVLQTLTKEYVKTGKNLVSLQLHSYPAGTYFLLGKNAENRIILNEKVIVLKK